MLPFLQYKKKTTSVLDGSNRSDVAPEKSEMSEELKSAGTRLLQAIKDNSSHGIVTAVQDIVAHEEASEEQGEQE